MLAEGIRLLEVPVSQIHGLLSARRVSEALREKVLASSDTQGVLSVDEISPPYCFVNCPGDVRLLLVIRAGSCNYGLVKRVIACRVSASASYTDRARLETSRPRPVLIRFGHRSG